MQVGLESNTFENWRKGLETVPEEMSLEAVLEAAFYLPLLNAECLPCCRLPSVVVCSVSASPVVRLHSGVIKRL